MNIIEIIIIITKPKIKGFIKFLTSVNSWKFSDFINWSGVISQPTTKHFFVVEIIIENIINYCFK